MAVAPYLLSLEEDEDFGARSFSCSLPLVTFVELSWVDIIVVDGAVDANAVVVFRCTKWILNDGVYKWMELQGVSAVAVDVDAEDAFGLSRISLIPAALLSVRLSTTVRTVR